MSYFKQTAQIRAEVKDGYVYVRNLAEKGGVIDASISAKVQAKVEAALSQVKDESFSQVWDMMIGIKGVCVEYSRN